MKATLFDSRANVEIRFNSQAESILSPDGQHKLLPCEKCGLLMWKKLNTCSFLCPECYKAHLALTGGMQHTPGPWVLMHLPFSDTDCGIDLKGNNGNTLIATFPTLEKVEGIAAIPGEEDAANLLLIAAAPDLLEACKALANLAIEKCPRCDGTGKRECGEVNEACSQCGGTGEETFNPHPDEIRQARAAIAKATGQNQ